MVRTITLALATFALTGATPAPAGQPKAGDEQGFHVYSVSPRCRSARLLGVYPSPGEAFEAAAKGRAGGYVEITTGSEGKRDNLPQTAALYHVYSMACLEAGWQRREIHGDFKKVQEVVKALEKKGDKVEVVRDHAPKTVFHVYSQPACRYVAGKRFRLLGTYVTIGEACEAAGKFRAAGDLRVEVSTGSKGAESFDGTPTAYEVYAWTGKPGWVSETTQDDGKKAQDAGAAIKKEHETAQVELVRHYGPKASATLAGKKVRFPEDLGEEGIGTALGLLASCSARSEGTAADLAAATKGDHVRLAFANPIEVRVSGGKVGISEVVLTLPLSTGVFWLRSGDKVLRASKFRPEKVAPFEAWLAKARRAD